MQAGWPDVLFTDAFQQRLRECRVLLVGAGGIGSEVLKTLALTGFRRISLVDLDTIETSNLNRQFLFRTSHVGESKAVVAAESVRGFLAPQPSRLPGITGETNGKDNSSGGDEVGEHIRKKRGVIERSNSLQITPFHANIKDTSFDVDFFTGFDIVLNGLDNLNARRHVNRLCFAAGVPLVESGSSGFEGSVTVHIRDHTHCYECEDKPVQKSYPICTIRNTPDKMIHCVVWAKDLLFARLFGDVGTVTDLDEDMNGNTNAADETNESKSFFLKTNEEDVMEYAERIFRRVFDEDIVSVRGMEDLWRSRAPPSPIGWPLRKVERDSFRPTTFSLYTVLGTEENSDLFVEAICSIYKNRTADVGRMVFDKEDDLSVRFVAAAANLRAICYSIPTSSIFEIKGMAGNIVHAVATTNATVAGLIVTEACKILAGCRHTARETFVGKHCLFGQTKRKRDILIKSMLPPEKNPMCATCGTAMMHVTLNAETMNLACFIEKVIKGSLGVSDPSLAAGGFLYEEGEGLDDDEREDYAALLGITLAALPGGGLRHGAILTVSSQVQCFSCKILISHANDIDSEVYPDQYVLEGSLHEENEAAESIEVTAPKRKRDEGLLGSGRNSNERNVSLSEAGGSSEGNTAEVVDDSSEDDEPLEFVSKKKKRASPKRKDSMRGDDQI